MNTDTPFPSVTPPRTNSTEFSPGDGDSLATFRPFDTKLHLSTDHRCFQCLNLSPLILNHFEAGYYHGSRGFLAHSLAVRIHDPAGNPLGYAGCRLVSSDNLAGMSWKKPRAFPPDRVIYNWHRTRPYRDQPLFIVPNPWAIMRLYSAGFMNAVALFQPFPAGESIRLLSDAPSPAIFILLGGTPPPRSNLLNLRRLVNKQVDFIVLPRDLVIDTPVDEDLERILSPYCR